MPARVLIVDDEPEMAAALLDNLAELGDNYLFEQANSAEEALSRVELVFYHLVLTDYKMPDMDGLDLARAVRLLSPETQVVMMTAYGTDRLRNTVKDLELGGFLNKPVSMVDIRAIVKPAIEAYSPELAHAAPSKELQPEVGEQLAKLQMNTGAYCVLLLSSSGIPLESVGFAQHLDVSGVSSLIAANFAASEELAKILGSKSVFKSSYFEGPDYCMYAHDVNGELLLAVIFGAKSKPGAVWFYAKEAAAGMAELVANEPIAIAAPDETTGEMKLDFASMWNGDGAERRGSGKPMSFDDAIARGLVRKEMGSPD